MPNQRSLAASLGLSQSTVSLALRNSPLIPENTRKTVFEAAARLGYRANPMVSTLMEHIRAGKTVDDQGCLAIIVDASSETDWLTHPAYRQQSESFRRRAILRGYRTECFFLRERGMSAQKIDKILRARGISGVFLAAPKRDSTIEVALSWECYSSVTIGFTWTNPPIDRVAPNHRHHIEMAVSELRRRGFHRIGFCLPEPALERVDSHWLAGFLLCQYRIPAKDRIPLFIGHPNTTPLPKFRKWHARWRPNALLCLNGAEKTWLDALGLEPGRDLAVACLYHAEGSSLAGIDENNEVVGIMACDLISSQIIHNERGIPQHQRTILIEGKWVDGSSVPIRRKTSRVS